MAAVVLGAGRAIPPPLDPSKYKGQAGKVGVVGGCTVSRTRLGPWGWNHGGVPPLGSRDPTLTVLSMWAQHQCYARALWCCGWALMVYWGRGRCMQEYTGAPFFAAMSGTMAHANGGSVHRIGCTRVAWLCCGSVSRPAFGETLARARLSPCITGRTCRQGSTRKPYS